jgi:hypothetical protein
VGQSYFVVSNKTSASGYWKFRDISGEVAMENVNPLNNHVDRRVIGNAAKRYPYGFSESWLEQFLVISFLGLRKEMVSINRSVIWGTVERVYSFFRHLTLNVDIDNPSQDAYFSRYGGILHSHATERMARVPKSRFLHAQLYLA